jgi:phenylacetate-CoA oxygenase PaaI subunit|tara:strand:+ start:51264 stop:52013 length:750 start_codon:yes stop_codon:yes gene_type:complete
MNKKMTPQIKYYLQIADSALIYSYRLRELSLFNTPFLNSLSQSDLTDHLLSIANITYKEVNGIQKKEEGHAFDIIRKKPEEYFNAILFELENKDEVFVIVRQFFVDTFHSFYYQELVKSKDAFLSKLATEKVDLFKNQVEKSRLWFRELKFSDEDKYKRTQKSINVLWEYSADFFQASTVDLVMLSREAGVDLHKVQMNWKIDIEKAVAEEGFKLPAQEGTFIGGKEGRHSRSFHSFLKRLKSEKLPFS